jgi:hypothetical protein
MILDNDRLLVIAGTITQSMNNGASGKVLKGINRLPNQQRRDHGLSPVETSRYRGQVVQMQIFNSDYAAGNSREYSPSPLPADA